MFQVVQMAVRAQYQAREHAHRLAAGDPEREWVVPEVFRAALRFDRPDLRRPREAACAFALAIAGLLRRAATPLPDRPDRSRRRGAGGTVRFPGRLSPVDADAAPREHLRGRQQRAGARATRTRARASPGRSGGAGARGHLTEKCGGNSRCMLS